MNGPLAAVTAKVMAAEQFRPRAWGWLLSAAGVMLIASGLQRPARNLQGAPAAPAQDRQP